VLKIAVCKIFRIFVEINTLKNLRTMKIFLKFTALSAFFLVLAGVMVSCNDNEEITLHPTECGIFSLNETEFVSWCLMPNNVLKLENHTKGILTYGVAYSLDFFNSGVWTAVPLTGLNWQAIGLGLSPGQTDEDCSFQTSLYGLVERFNNSQRGKYRISRQYALHETDAYFKIGRPIVVFDLSVEFLVK